jgi:hypothetical protein
MLRRARCKAHRDVLAFVRDVFIGRNQVLVSDLFALAAKRGLPKKEVRMTVKSQGHRLKRPGRHRHRQVYYRNRNSDSENELPKISNSELTGRAPEYEDPPSMTFRPKSERPQRTNTPSYYLLDTPDSEVSEEDATIDLSEYFRK